MKCTAYEKQIALYLEGDLSDSDRQRVETHLQSCAVCTALAEELRESQSMFKALRAATVSPSDLAGVRDRVLNEVGDLEPAPGWVVMMNRLFFAGMRRRNAIAGVLIAALVTGSASYLQWRAVGEKKDEAPVAVASLEVPPPALVSDVIVPPANLDLVVKGGAPVQVFEALPVVEPEVQLIDVPIPAESKVWQIPMKFVTDDPDIIIYWLPSDKGD